MKHDAKYYRDKMKFMQEMYERLLEGNEATIKANREIIAQLNKRIEISERIIETADELMIYKMKVGDILERYRKN